MTDERPAIEVFHDEQDGIESVGLILRNISIVEVEEDELVPGCTLTPWHARCLAHTLVEIADRIEGKLPPVKS